MAKKKYQRNWLERKLDEYNHTMELIRTILPFLILHLDNEVTKGLVPAQVEYVKESVIEINEELNCVGQSLRAVAASL